MIAQCLLGSMFQLGSGVERDGVTAKQWYQQAGSQDCALSFYNLATIYEVDEQNPALAEYYHQQAKDMGCDLME
ncbi:hypothetical protein ACSYAD_07060 [Acaryochloris marina NIES-2412]|uniref:hypothetical protein n=1 Tax=Acaryochloris marina TaxID=155978 RepID=UPI0040590DF3